MSSATLTFNGQVIEPVAADKVAISYTPPFFFEELCARQDRWQALCKRIKVGGPMPVEFKVDLNASDRVAIIARVLTWDRDQEFEVRAKYEYEPGSFDDDNLHRTASTTSLTRPEDRWVHLHATMYGEPDTAQLLLLAERLYKHEIRELFLLDGKRIYDPHVPGAADQVPK